ncbi:MAG TPA: 50S ribosomal protein L11 methyltransferase [Dysgonamonadaceae bacterium]|nr:50S ribosomal protein L11 methyltransferase [Dysgonamonadaceae bacterium]
MKYVQVFIRCIPDNDMVKDVLAYRLSEIGYDSFIPAENGLEAYIPISLFSDDKLKNVISNFDLDAEFEYLVVEMEDRDWNEEWEKNYFEPIVIDNRCLIQSSFHQPKGIYEYRILIDPKMAFGTGHHQTTGLILRQILDMNLENKSVLDMGCGTAVLAILAAFRNANPVVAIDIDEWAFNNALENVKLNNVPNIRVELGGAELLGKETFDVIFANINRNVLLQDIPIYSSVLNDGGVIVMSGFYTDDIPAIRSRCEEYVLHFSHFAEDTHWASVVCIK